MYLPGMLGVGLVCADVINALVGGASLVKPLAFHGICTRLQGARLRSRSRRPGLVSAGHRPAPSSNLGTAVLTTRRQLQVRAEKAPAALSTRIAIFW